MGTRRVALRVDSPKTRQSQQPERNEFLELFKGLEKSSSSPIFYKESAENTWGVYDFLGICTPTKSL